MFNITLNYLLVKRDDMIGKRETLWVVKIANENFENARKIFHQNQRLSF